MTGKERGGTEVNLSAGNSQTYVVVEPLLQNMVCMNPDMYPFPSGRDALVLLDAIIKNVSKLVTKVMSRYRVREINWGRGGGGRSG